MVMALTETIFDEATDDLHHLKIDGQANVILGELRFVKRGTVDAWLMSEVFGLGQPRSREAEIAIEAAKGLQLADSANDQDVQDVDAKLVQYLAPDDEFWPRWRFFAKNHGVR